MRATLVRSLGTLFLVLMLVLAACGGEEAAEEPTTAAEPTEAPTEEEEDPTPEEEDPAPEEEEPEPEESTSGAVNSLEDVEQAVIQIVAEGTFVDPEVGLQLNAAGSGSGFIIDPSGIAVTNNHVVTGAALLRVFVGGDDQPLNARVLGVSECSDLAVIDIEGDGFPYLEWYDDEIKVGLDVFAAGFPLGDPEFTLTRGIVSKAETSGETSWASVDEVIEHDATINPGNSGGPLIDENGKIVAINYSGSSETNQYYAIAREEALSIIEILQEGEDVTSIGVNGEAVQGDDVTGIWVASVKSGSPADEARIQPGDIITSIEGLVLATDGTMSDYCDILRSRRPDDTMSIEVLRFSTQEQLVGQLNGRELEVAFSFAQQEADSAPDPDDGAAEYTDYRTITDDTGTLQMQVPVEWEENRGLAWSVDDQDVGVSIVASPSIDGFYETWETPGVFFGASSSLIATLDENTVLDTIDFSNECTYDSREPYEDALYTGFYDTWLSCGGTDTAFYVISVVPEDRSFLGLVQIQVVTEDDLVALDQIIRTFQVVGALPGSAQQEPVSEPEEASSEIPEGWQEVTSEAGAFSVLMPGEPQEQTETVETEVGPVDAIFLQVATQEAAYQVVYSDYPAEMIAASDTDMLFQGAINGALENIDGELVSEEVVEIDGNPGREFVAEASLEGISIIYKGRYFLVGNRLYQVFVVGDTSTIADEDITLFIDSFVLLQ